MIPLFVYIQSGGAKIILTIGFSSALRQNPLIRLYPNLTKLKARFP